MVCQLLPILEVQGSNLASSPLYALKYFLGLSFTFITCAYIYDSHLVPIVTITPYTLHLLVFFSPFHTIFMPLPKIFTTAWVTMLEGKKWQMAPFVRWTPAFSPGMSDMEIMHHSCQLIQYRSLGWCLDHVGQNRVRIKPSACLLRPSWHFL